MARTVDFAKKELENSNKDVREAAYNCILHFMKAVGTEKVEPMLDGKLIFYKILTLFRSEKKPAKQIIR